MSKRLKLSFIDVTNGSPVAVYEKHPHPHHSPSTPHKKKRTVMLPSPFHLENQLPSFVCATEEFAYYGWRPEAVERKGIFACRACEDGAGGVLFLIRIPTAEEHARCQQAMLRGVSFFQTTERFLQVRFFPEEHEQAKALYRELRRDPAVPPPALDQLLMTVKGERVIPLVPRRLVF